MPKHYLCTAKLEREVDGKPKKVSEKYLVRAELPSDAQMLVMNELTPFALDGVEVSSINEEAVSSVCEEDGGESWFKVVYDCLDIDEKTGKLKKSRNASYVTSDSIQEAVATFIRHSKDFVNDYEIVSVVKSPVLELFIQDTTTQSENN